MTDSLALRAPLFSRPAVRRLAIFLPICVYLLAAVVQGYLRRSYIAPDEICYIINARYLLQGDFWKSVSSHWSPLYSWCIALVQCMGADPLYAARIVVGFWGLMAVIATYFFLRSLTKRIGWASIGAMIIVAVDLALFSMYVSDPDIIISALLLAYCAVTLSTDFVRRPGLQICAGLLGGMAYLAKAYAFPFVLVHYSLMLAHTYSTDRKSLPFRKVLAAWIVGLIAFFVVAGPWIAILTKKSGHLTFSTAGTISRDLMGPEDHGPVSLLVRNLYEVPPGRLATLEVAEDYLSHVWSPFESKAYFVYQVKYALNNAAKILYFFTCFDVLSMTLVALAFTPLILSRPGSKERRRKAQWVLGTLACYAAGYTPVLLEWRYIQSFAFPICCVYCLGFSAPLWRQLTSRWNISIRARQFAMALAVASFFVATCARYLLGGHDTVQFGIHSRQWANTLREAGVQGPLATLEEKQDREQWQPTYYLSYLLNLPFSGVVDPELSKNRDVAGVEQQLKKFGVKTLIVPEEDELKWFQDHTSWKLLQSLKASDQSFDVFVPPGEK